MQAVYQYQATIYKKRETILTSGKDNVNNEKVYIVLSLAAFCELHNKPSVYSTPAKPQEEQGVELLRSPGTIYAAQKTLLKFKCEIVKEGWLVQIDSNKSRRVYIVRRTSTHVVPQTEC